MHAQQEFDLNLFIFGVNLSSIISNHLFIFVTVTNDQVDNGLTWMRN
jgi:hypothetical protein